MTLVLETGAIISGANTYALAATIRDFALARGITLPSPDETIEVLAFQAMDYLESYRDQYKGEKVEATQPLQWPRENVEIDGNEWPDDQIPIELINAECQLCILVNSGVVLFPTYQPSQAVKRQKVDVIEREFFTASEMGGAMFVTPTLSSVDMWLSPLLEMSFGLRTVRI